MERQKKTLSKKDAKRVTCRGFHVEHRADFRAIKRGTGPRIGSQRSRNKNKK